MAQQTTRKDPLKGGDHSEGFCAPPQLGSRAFERVRVGRKNSEGFGLVARWRQLLVVLREGVSFGLVWLREGVSVARVMAASRCGCTVVSNCVRMLGCESDPGDCHVGARWCLTVFGCSDASQILAIAMWVHGGV